MNQVIDGKRKKRRAEGDDSSSSASGTPTVSAKKSKTYVDVNYDSINLIYPNIIYRHHNILTHGTSVAAKQPKQKDKNEEWILAVVISYNNDKNR